MTRLTLNQITVNEDYSTDGVLTVSPDEYTFVLLGHMDEAAATRGLPDWLGAVKVVEVTHRWVTAETHAADCDLDSTERAELEGFGERCDCLDCYGDESPGYALSDSAEGEPEAFAVTEADCVDADEDADEDAGPDVGDERSAVTAASAGTQTDLFALVGEVAG